MNVILQLSPRPLYAPTLSLKLPTPKFELGPIYLSIILTSNELNVIKRCLLLNKNPTSSHLTIGLLSAL